MVRSARRAGVPEASSAVIKTRMETTRQKDTQIEREVRSRLHRLGYRFRKDARPGNLVRSRADLIFPTARVAVFLDGCFWHVCPEHATWPKSNAAWWQAKLIGNQARDRAVVKALEKNGWTALRFWEHEDPIRIAAAIAKVVTRRTIFSRRRRR